MTKVAHPRGVQQFHFCNEIRWLTDTLMASSRPQTQVPMANQNQLTPTPVVGEAAPFLLPQERSPTRIGEL